MEYIKFNIDEMYQEIVFYIEIKDGVKGPYIKSILKKLEMLSLKS